MIPPRLDWSQILRLVGEGDELAFLKLSRLITRFLGDFDAFERRGEWDDIIQDVVFKAITADARGQIRSPSAVVAFLRVSTRNRLIDHLRKGSREFVFDEIDEVASTADWHGGSRATKGAVLVEKFDLQKAVELLPNDHRVAVLSVYAEGMTYQEAAEETGIPLGSLKRYLREGLEKLGRSLGTGYQLS